MKKTAILFLLFLSYCGVQSKDIHHKIHASVDITNHTVNVADVITLHEKPADNSIEFYLNGDFSLETDSKHYAIEEMPLSADDKSRVALKKYRMTALTNTDKSPLIFEIKYSGKVFDEIKYGAAEYARGFSETSGIISEEGIFLAASTVWVPYVKDNLYTFEMTTEIDSAWNVVSQGKRTLNITNGDKRLVTYNCPYPMDEVYLCAAKWHEYSIKVGETDVQASLREADEELAQRYLRMTGMYMKTYIDMIGEYPFSKFALVENFWETGYGMPSFTLLGPKVIRFPFILFTSYPHELLHNWWGNSVYVNYDHGNWCEGITAYMADHLFKEQKGEGSEYRRVTLQKYADFVNEENDFPVSEFKSRHNAAEEAIGYGKSLMFNHMLRKMVGDENFKKAYSKFYQDYKFKYASFDDIRVSFEQISGKNLKSFFKQWIERKGAPKIELSEVRPINDAGGYAVSFKLAQTQNGDIFDLSVPVAVFEENSDFASIHEVVLSQKENTFTIRTSGKPLKITVDPLFDIFRLLDRDETPSTLSQVYGSKESIMILPSASEFLAEYKEFADKWQASQKVQGKSAEIISDQELDKLPADKTVWVMGTENKFNAESAQAAQKFISEIPAEKSELYNSLLTNGSVIYSVPNPGDNNNSLCFMSCNIKSAFPGLLRKLPHYGKYSFLGFENEEPKNVLKGEFPLLDSPLTKYVPYQHNRKYFPTEAKINPSEPLVK